MVAARIAPCSVSVMTRSTNFSPAVGGAALGAGAGFAREAAAESLGPATERDDLAGELAAAPEEPDVATGALAPAPETLVPEAGDTLEALGAELLLGFAACAAACLHRSDSESLCS